MAKPASPQRRRMENFRKVRSEEAPVGSGDEEGGPGSGPFADLAPGAVHMRVKEGSKIRNLLAFATASMAQPATRAIVFSGCGRATTKTVTCAEILKRRLAGLHQVTRLRYQSVRELWQSLPPEPRQPTHPAPSFLEGQGLARIHIPHSTWGAASLHMQVPARPAHVTREPFTAGRLISRTP